MRLNPKNVKMLDIKTVISSPENGFEAVDAMVKSEQKLIDAIHIMQSVIDNPDEKEFHERKMKKFLEQFKKP